MNDKVLCEQRRGEEERLGLNEISFSFLNIGTLQVRVIEKLVMGFHLELSFGYCERETRFYEYFT